MQVAAISAPGCRGKSTPSRVAHLSFMQAVDAPTTSSAGHILHVTSMALMAGGASAMGCAVVQSAAYGQLPAACNLVGFSFAPRALSDRRGETGGTVAAQYLFGQQHADALPSNGEGGKRLLGRDELKRLVHAAAEALVGTSLGAEQPLVDAGMDSLGAVELRNGLQVGAMK